MNSYTNSMCIVFVLVSNSPKILVIGAGIAGLTAARQLQSFGFNVTMIESRVSDFMWYGFTCTFYELMQEECYDIDCCSNDLQII